MEQLEEAIDSGTTVAFTNKTMVDTKTIKTCLEDLRLNLPVEIAQARKVLAERYRGFVEQHEYEHCMDRMEQMMLNAAKEHAHG